MVKECRPYCKTGKVASYIPELSAYDKNLLGIYLIRTDLREHFAGDSTAEFTMQSVSKVLILLAALIDTDLNRIKTKISFEPSHDGFNSIVNLETRDSHKPLNPFINSGAILSIGFSNGKTYEDKFCRILSLLHEITGNKNIGIHEGVYKSEKMTGSRNRALAYFMKSVGVLDGDVEEVLDAYFKICAIKVTVKELAQIAATLANRGISVSTGKRVFSPEAAQTVNAMMMLCGMYDESGSFAVSVGLPSKSGVGGGIMSVSPGKVGVGIYGPALNEKGSSIAGIELLKKLRNELDIGVF